MQDPDPNARRSVPDREPAGEASTVTDPDPNRSASVRDADAEPRTTEPGVTDPDPEAADAETADAEADAAASAEAEATEPAAAPRPPRIDGTYLGGTMLAGIGLIRVNDFDTPGAFAAFGGSFTVGQMVFPWLGLGLHGGGGGGVHSKDAVRQKLGQGHLGVQFKFVPLPKRRVPLSLLASFGFGGGAVRQEGLAKRSGFGGAQFGAAVRYELFPWAARRRPYRGGGFGLGPELGWVGFTPAAAGRPMSNVFYLALSATFYFGS